MTEEEKNGQAAEPVEPETAEGAADVDAAPESEQDIEDAIGAEADEAVAGVEPVRIVYVSCSPATLARDVKLLSALGYTAEAARPVDMFPHTGHVETVCLLSKLNTK